MLVIVCVAFALSRFGVSDVGLFVIVCSSLFGDELCWTAASSNKGISFELDGFGVSSTFGSGRPGDGSLLPEFQSIATTSPSGVPSLESIRNNMNSKAHKMTAAAMIPGTKTNRESPKCLCQDFCFGGNAGGLVGKDVLLLGSSGMAWKQSSCLEKIAGT